MFYALTESLTYTHSKGAHATISTESNRQLDDIPHMFLSCRHLSRPKISFEYEALVRDAKFYILILRSIGGLSFG